MKNENCNKSLITAMKFFTFIFCNSSILKPNFHVTIVRGWKRCAPSQQPNGSDSDNVLRSNQSLMEKTSYTNYKVVGRADPQAPSQISYGIWKRIDFARKYSLGKCRLYYYVSSKVYFSVAGYLKRSNETPTSIQICTGLVDVVHWTENIW